MLLFPRVPADIAPLEPLCCPYCGDKYLHHGSIEVYSRDRDYAETTALLVESANNVSKIKHPENPSIKRDGIIINFHCEHCEEEENLRLAMVQHKGQTFFYWLE